MARQFLFWGKRQDIRPSSLSQKTQYPSRRGTQNLFHTFSLLGRLEFVMAASVLAGGAVGFVLQKQLGFTFPGLTILGVVLGVWVGLRQTYRAIMKTMPEEHSEKDSMRKNREREAGLITSEFPFEFLCFLFS